MTTNPRLIVEKRQSLLEVGVRLWQENCLAALNSRGRFSVALSGGTTPADFYELVAERLEASLWEETHLFQVDERQVPPAHSRRNWGMIRRALVDRVGLAPGNLHPVPWNGSLVKAVREYEESLRFFFNLAAGEMPRFDLVVLGLGVDGHTASLFPGRPELDLRDRAVAGVLLGEPLLDRITLSLPVLNQARRVVFLITGAGKAPAVEKFLGEKSRLIPGSLVDPVEGEVVCLLDPPAAGRFFAPGNKEKTENS